ncbi:tripartite tricarboxylate transporter TctB family protein [Parasedimentitalea huanghaiensis]|uniref:Tripartite tricarboxylate transporter TctB family protein n=1 Tax=Parasedimentitalea huanghaiensis TaxID=2682100 RepID=A0A6L6WJC6_9RHOB|nr:tripartite tricarboxylate transporter TctB family protein [Zongyanglinia huanghaiensis]MVO16675.1 tripartite tricarboxylate transporter TctB family protein [Zongyanglinia huanghaiensis]
MALDRWIALIILMICMAYGYAAFFTMDAGLPPFMQRNAIWPSTFPKVLSVLAITCALIILLGQGKGDDEAKEGDINYRRLMDYNLGQALLLLAMMAGYALMLRPVGFLISTVAFLTLGAMVLGERKLQFLLPVTLLATGLVWYLVQQVLGIYLRPLPYVFGTGG